MIKLFLKRILVSNKKLLLAFSFLIKLKNSKSYFKHINGHKTFNQFVYSSKKLPFFPISLIIDNNMYGIEYIVRRYSKINNFLMYYIEHGIFFGNHIQSDQLNYFSKKYLVPSSIRSDFLKACNNNIKVVAIGPYIHYANIINLKYLRTKKGKTLLFFPDHTTASILIQQNIKKNIDLINRIKKDYQITNVIISLFYLDLDNSHIKKYKEMGYNIFCAGSKWDYNFMDRLKSVISISDLTISNSVGTHIGYCIYLNKPHTIVNTSYKKKYNYSHKLINNVINSELNTTRAIQTNEIHKYFFREDKSIYLEINKEQYNICSKYWGFEFIRSETEMFDILNEK